MITSITTHSLASTKVGPNSFRHLEHPIFVDVNVEALCSGKMQEGSLKLFHYTQSDLRTHINVSKSRLETAGVRVISNRPIRATSKTTLKKNGRFYSYGRPLFKQVGRSSRDGATSWEYCFSIPVVMLHEIETQRA